MRRDSPVICLLSFRSRELLSRFVSFLSLLQLLPCLCPDLRTFDAILLDSNLCSCHIVTCLPVVISFFRHPFTNQMHAHKTQHANIHKTCCPSEIKKCIAQQREKFSGQKLFGLLRHVVLLCCCQVEGEKVIRDYLASWSDG
jgi:hypothetical protein